jgi:hypothetical protein
MHQQQHIAGAHLTIICWRISICRKVQHPPRQLAPYVTLANWQQRQIAGQEVCAYSTAAYRNAQNSSLQLAEHQLLAPLHPACLTHAIPIV